MQKVRPLCIRKAAAAGNVKYVVLLFFKASALGAQTAQIAAAKAAAKVQEGAAQAYDVSKQKASEAYTSTAEYLKEKVGPCAAPQTLQSCRPASAPPAGMPCR